MMVEKKERDFRERRRDRKSLWKQNMSETCIAYVISKCNSVNFLLDCDVLSYAIFAA